jgi:6,7-dimethyl-8-ribityllumazine synthase
MSGVGAPKPEKLDGAKLRVAVIAAKWHTQVMDGLLAGAERALVDAGVKPRNSKIIRVPGTFELPVAAARLAKSGNFDAIVALGVVVRGGTPHFEYVCEAATNGLTLVTVQTGIPVGFGVLTCDNDAQALDRAGLPGSNEDKGYEATHAAVETALTLSEYWRGL